MEAEQGTEMMECIARACMRWDTVVARAFRIALGLPASFRKPGRAIVGSEIGSDIAELFANREHINF